MAASVITETSGVLGVKTEEQSDLRYGSEKWKFLWALPLIRCY